MADFIIKPWAVAGDKTTIPVDAQPDGSQSWEEGYPLDYQLEQGVAPTAKDIPRDMFNELMYQLSNGLRQYQTTGFPDFIEPSDNDGSPFPYAKNAYVTYDDGTGPAVYYSLVTANVADPTDATKWSRLLAPQAVPTGTIWEFDGTTLPATWIWPDGKTVGNVSSGANYTGAAYQAIFLQIWADFPNAVRPILDSSGAASTRGASAAADWTANKRLPVADKRGCVTAACDNLGGTGAGRLTNAVAGGVDGTVLGNRGGLQSCSLTGAQNGAHTHAPGTLVTDSAGAHTHNVQYGGASTTTTYFGPPSKGVDGAPSNYPTTSNGAHTHVISGATASSGTGDAHNNVQPTYVTNFILKL